jgi:mannose-6-phosphate isomerase-like protein (cupin superfamily)
MKPKIIRLKSLKENDYGRTRTKSILNTKDYPKFSVVIVKRISTAPMGNSPISDTLNYVLKGKGKITVNKKIYKVEVGDSVFIPKNTNYKTSKGLTLLVVSCPRFNRSRHVYPKN